MNSATSQVMWYRKKIYCINCGRQIYGYFYDKGLALPLCGKCAVKIYTANSNSCE